MLALELYRISIPDNNLANLSLAANNIAYGFVNFLVVLPVIRNTPVAQDQLGDEAVNSMNEPSNMEKALAKLPEENQKATASTSSQ